MFQQLHCSETPRESEWSSFYSVKRIKTQHNTQLLCSEIWHGRTWPPRSTVLFIWFYRFPSVQRFTGKGACPWAQIIRLGTNIYTFSAEVAGVFHHVVLSVVNLNLKENKHLCATTFCFFFFLAFLKINTELCSLAKKRPFATGGRLFHPHSRC